MRRDDRSQVLSLPAEILREPDRAFAVEDGIALLLPEAAVARGEKQSVRTFYEEIGWQKEDELYEDTARFVAGSATVERYLAAGRRRIGAHLPATGTYLLDVASGPVQFPEYLDYQRGYAHRVCVDFSLAALREARANAGDQAILVQGDITRLPFADGTMDAIVSLHTIYHVPRDEQASAFCELYRVLKPGGRAVIAYSWGHTHWGELTARRKLLHLPGRVAGKLRRMLAARRAPSAPATAEPELYFHAFDHHWFVRQDWPFRYRIVTNRLFMASTLERLARVPGLLATIALIEARFPSLCGRYGRYPLILIEK